MHAHIRKDRWSFPSHQLIARTLYFHHLPRTVCHTRHGLLLRKIATSIKASVKSNLGLDLDLEICTSPALKYKSVAQNCAIKLKSIAKEQSLELSQQKFTAQKNEHINKSKFYHFKQRLSVIDSEM